MGCTARATLGECAMELTCILSSSPQPSSGRCISYGPSGKHTSTLSGYSSPLPSALLAPSSYGGNNQHNTTQPQHSHFTYMTGTPHRYGGRGLTRWPLQIIPGCRRGCIAGWPIVWRYWTGGDSFAIWTRGCHSG